MIRTTKDPKQQFRELLAKSHPTLPAEGKALVEAAWELTQAGDPGTAHRAMGAALQIEAAILAAESLQPARLAQITRALTECLEAMQATNAEAFMIIGALLEGLAAAGEAAELEWIYNNRERIHSNREGYDA